MTDDPSDPAEHPTDAPGDGGASRRPLVVVGGLIALWVLVLVLLTLLDHVAVVWKSLVVPVLVLAAALTGRVRAFIHDWAVFVGAVMLFDAGRGFVYGLVHWLNVPVHMAYAIEADRALFGDPLLIVRLQHWIAPHGEASLFVRALGMIYGSHFVAFLLFGMAVWLLRPDAFRRFKTGMVLNMYLGLVGYLLVPTVPPWMAADVFLSLPDLVDVGGDMFHTSLPTITAAFEINPVAAMPSLHCAFPTFMAILCFRLFPAAAVPFVLYTLTVFLSTMVLAHHYAVDVLGGMALGVIAYGISFHVPALARLLRLDLRTEPADVTAVALRTRILVVVLLMAVMATISVIGSSLARVPGRLDHNTPTEEFIRRELDGRTPAAEYYRAMLALEHGKHEEAAERIGRAHAQLPESHVRFAHEKIAVVAHENGDFPAVVASVQKLKRLEPPMILIMADALVRTGDLRQGHGLLDAYLRMAPGDPIAGGLKAQLIAEFGEPPP